MGMPGKESPVKFASLLFFEKFNGASRGQRSGIQGFPDGGIFVSLRQSKC
jgi:hypothetical protein